MSIIPASIFSVPIDEEQLKQIHGAIQALFVNSNTPNSEEIMKANEYLNTFKSNPLCLLYGFELIQPKYSDVIRSYGFNALISFIKTSWQFVDGELKKLIVQKLFDYIKMGTKGTIHEAPFIKEMIGTIFSEIAKREWPQRMSTLLDDLNGLIYMGMDTCQIALTCLRTFILDVSPEFSNDIDSDRKREILKNLQKMMTLDFFGNLVVIFMKIHTQYSISHEKQDKDLLLTSKLIMNEMLSLIQALMVEWVPTNYIFIKKIPHQLCRYLTNDDFRMKVVETLVTITHLPWKVNEIDLFTDFILEFCQYTNSIMSTKGLLEEEYEFNKSLCYALEGILNTNFSKVMNKKKDDKKNTLRIGSKNLPCVTELVKILVNFLEHPSFHFTEILVPVWKNVFQSGSPISSQLFFKLECPRIFESCFLKLHKEVANPDNIDYFPDSKVTSFSLLEWEDARDFKTSHDDIVQCIKEILQSIVNIDHKISLDYIEHLCRKLSMCTSPNPNTDKVDETTGVITMKSMTFLRWDAASRLVERVVGSLDLKQDSALINCVNRLIEIFRNMIGLKITDPLIDGRYLDLMKNFYPLYDQNKDALGALLNRIVSTIRYRNQNEGGVSALELSPDTIRVRKKALVTLIFICKKIPKKMITFLDQILSLSESLWSNKEISGSELVLLYEALIVVSNYIQAKGKKQEFLKYLLSTPKRDIVTDQVISMCDDVESMLKMFDLLPEPDQNRKVVLNALFDKLKFALHLFVSAGDSIEEFSEGEKDIGEMLFDILKPVHSLTRTLHRFKTTEIFNRLPEFSQKVLSIGHLKGEIAVQLGMDLIGTSPEEQHYRKVRKNLHSIYTACYKVFGLVCKYSSKDGFYRNPGLKELLTSSILFNFSKLQSDNLQQILKFFVTPFIENCPADLVHSIAVPALLTIFQQVSVHLEQGWTESLARKNGQIKSNFTMEEEIILDSMLIALDEEIMRIPLSLSNALTSGTKSKLTAVSKAMIESGELMLQILNLCFNLLSVPDISAASKAVVFIGRILPLCATNNFYDEILARDINMALLRTLTVSKFSEKHNIIQVISDIFSWYKKKNSRYLELVYQQIPDVTEAKWRQLLDNYERNIRTKNGDKKFRKILSTFLQPIMDSKSSSMNPKIGRISFPDPPKKINEEATMNLNSIFR